MKHMLRYQSIATSDIYPQEYQATDSTVKNDPKPTGGNGMKSTLVIRLMATTFIGAGVALPALAADVTPQRLRDAASEPHNWLMVNGSYDSHRHSSLSQINRGNVANLRVKFTQALGGTDLGSDKNPPNQQSIPLVDDGFLYIANGWSEVLKIDVRNGNRGQIVWTNDAKVDRTVPGRARGVALLGKNVYHTPPDARLVGIDRDSGQ